MVRVSRLVLQGQHAGQVSAPLLGIRRLPSQIIYAVHNFFDLIALYFDLHVGLLYLLLETFLLVLHKEYLEQVVVLEAFEVVEQLVLVAVEGFAEIVVLVVIAEVDGELGVLCERRLLDLFNLWRRLERPHEGHSLLARLLPALPDAAGASLAR